MPLQLGPVANVLNPKDESPLYGNMDDYGSYELKTNLTVSIAGIKDYSSYGRTLDLETAVHTVSYTANGANFNTLVLTPTIYTKRFDHLHEALH